jgi:uncharacterized membrane protein YhaH (DUF805 family)
MYWYLMVLDKCTQFDARSRRKEFWIFELFNILIILALFVARFISPWNTGHNEYGEAALFIPLALYILAIIIPGLAVTVRRLHDTGKSGWMILLCLIPIVGGIIVLVFTVLDSDPGPNQYGPNPKLGGFPHLDSGYETTNPNPPL